MSGQRTEERLANRNPERYRPDPNWAAVNAIGGQAEYKRWTIPDEPALARELVAVFSDPDMFVRSMAARAVVPLRASKPLTEPALKQLLSDPEQYVRDSASEALKDVQRGSLFKG